MKAVEAGGEVEGRAECVRVQGDTLAHQSGIFVALTGNKQTAHDVGEVEPFDHSPLGRLPAGCARLQAFGSENTELSGDTGEHEDDGDGQREGDIELGCPRLPQLRGSASKGEVDGEEPGEEHHLASEPDDGPDRDRVGAVDSGGVAGGLSHRSHPTIMPDYQGRGCQATLRFSANYDRKMTEISTWPALLAKLLEGTDLSVSQATWAMSQVMSGEVSDSQIAGFLVALRAKGETVDEVVGFRTAVLDNAVPLDIPAMVLDIVGTGGDPYRGVINVSSIASIVASAAGAPVVKHGNRAASSQSGASDVLTELGVNLELTPDQVAEVWRKVGLTFVFAAKFHPGFKNAVNARRELGIPTIFNILGPLCNPVRPEASAVGVADLARVPQMAGVFATRGATALLYRGDDGIDKMTTTGHSRVWEVTGGKITEHVVNVEELGLKKTRIDDLLGDSPQHNAEVARAVLAGENIPARDIVVLNTAAGLTAFDLASDPGQYDVPLRKRLVTNIARAEEVIDSGKAREKLDQWREATHSV